MKTSDVFKAAKLQLWDGVPKNYSDDKHSHICLAIEIADVPTKYQRKAQRIVQKLIHPYATLSCWLQNEKHINPMYKSEKLQVTRHAWLDHLIAHYESIGD
jgi:hypothetical protein